MIIKKFTRDYSRRQFIKSLGVAGASMGVLSPLWSVLAEDGDHTRAYPEELLSLDAYTGGKISDTGTITANNVDMVKDLLDPIQYLQVKELGRVLNVMPQTSDIYRLNPYDYLEATFRNSGQATFDADGNVKTKDGKPWIGGTPFPNPKNGVEVFANATLSWGRHDASLYPVKETDLDAEGNTTYSYESVWIEYQATGRVSMDPKPYWPGHEDKLRYQNIIFMKPNDVAGTSFLNIWHYDQRKFPDLHGYLPAFKRVRRFPTNQRFEPLIAGNTLYLSDAWAAGDPFLLWGNFKIVHRGPYLAAVADSWTGKDDNWEHTTHGGKENAMFWDTKVQLVPEAIVVEAEPTGFSRAPVGKKRVWFDARTQSPISMVTYDRRGQVFKSFDGAYSVYEANDKRVMDGDKPYWSWTRVHAFDAQSGRMTRLAQVAELQGGYSMKVNDPSLYDKYLTVGSLRRLGI